MAASTLHAFSLLSKKAGRTVAGIWNLEPGSLDFPPPADKHTTLMIFPVTETAAGLYLPAARLISGPRQCNIGTVRVDFNPLQRRSSFVE